MEYASSPPVQIPRTSIPCYSDAAKSNPNPNRYEPNSEGDADPPTYEEAVGLEALDSAARVELIG